MSSTRALLSPKAIAARLHITVNELRTLRRRGLFPDADARINQWLGWESDRVDRYFEEDLARTSVHVQRRHGPFVPGSHPKWWEVDTVRYIGLAELAEAAVMSRAAVWSHYYNGKLPAPDITIGNVNRVAGWSPANAVRLARAQGWPLDLARLDDTSGLGAEL
jgi:predicted DNA-binding transcriptional regulator AlpA